MFQSYNNKVVFLVEFGCDQLYSYDSEPDYMQRSISYTDKFQAIRFAFYFGI